LIFDEVQTGCGRTGNWFAYQHFGITPDIMTLAKAICSGVAGAAMLTTAELAVDLRPGMHAATFGGNPLAAAAGIATLETIEQNGLLQRAAEIEQRFVSHFERMAEQVDCIQEVRAVGAMIGIQLNTPGAAIVERCLQRRLLINCTQQSVLRFLPALTITDAEIDKGCEIILATLSQPAT
jgi:acetylornithine/succinyldiaminopimelate/putrescine aminotransferase